MIANKKTKTRTQFLKDLKYFLDLNINNISRVELTVSFEKPSELLITFNDNIVKQKGFMEK